MCGRYAMYGPLSRHARELGLDELPDEVELGARYNVAPTMPAAVFALARDDTPRALRLTWGFAPRWLDPGKRQINATLERAPVSPMFREAWRARRCAVPADGWYEWVGASRPKTPYFLHRADAVPLFFAGLFENDTFAIITTTPQPEIAGLHNRMPLLLAPDQLRPWLAIGEIDATRQHPLEAYAVSRRVNAAANEGPDLVEPASAVPHPANGAPDASDPGPTRA